MPKGSREMKTFQNSRNLQHSKLFLKISIYVFFGLSIAGTLYKWVEKRPAPDFPTTLNGVPVVWVPDREARSVAEFVGTKRILHVELEGQGLTGVPERRVVEKPENIALLIKGMKVAVKPRNAQLVEQANSLNKSLKSFPGSPGTSFMNEEADAISFIYLEPNGNDNSVSLPFYADQYGHEREFMVRGTFSPEFQDALRAVGIPKHPDLSLVEAAKSDWFHY